MTTLPTASAHSSRWDESRSIAELEGRLTRAASPNLENPPANIDAVKALLLREAGRVPTVQNWVNAVALIQQAAQANPAFDLVEYLKGIAEQVIVWNNAELFVNIADKMPGKLTADWFATTLAVKGPEFLIVNTQRMPYRLWKCTEELLKGDEALKELFVKKVKQAFKEDKLTPDHYFWMWKSAPKSDPDRARLLAKPFVLFRLLQRELKGNFLKSQRDLRRLLLTDASFQKALTLDGDEAVARDLITCARRVLLLDNSERQALLVKLCGLYENLKPIVSGTPEKQRLAIAPQTSIHSFMALKQRLQDIIDVEIPANEEAIKTAKAHGDLSENSEFKAAKEHQRELGRLRAQLEQQVATIAPTNYAEVKVKDTVVPGSVVTIRYAEDEHTEKFTILGLLDTNPDKNQISYDTPLGKALVGKENGDEVTLPNQKKAVVESIAPLDDMLLEELGK